MFKNYLTIAFRNLMRHKGYSAINIFGLAVGLACCILILLFVQDELRYDRFHKKADQIYRVLWDARYGDNTWTIPFGPVPVADALRNFSEVEHVTRFRRESKTMRNGSEYVQENHILYVENSFFDVFTIPFLAGNSETPLNNPNAVVMTEKTAQRYFHSQNPIGQMLAFNDGTQFIVSGIVKDLLVQSHFHFDFLMPIETLTRFEQRRKDWASASVYAYLVLRKDSKANVVETRLAEAVEKQGRIKQNDESGNYARFLLQPMVDIHLSSHYDLELAPNGDMMHVYLFSLIAIFILALACINYVNLATARASKRAREVGIRKVLGSYRAQLIRQFLLDSLVYILLSVVLAFGLSELGLPFLNNFSGKQIAMADMASASVIFILSGIILLVALLSGAYPAFFLAAFRPIKVLKAQDGGEIRRSYLRNGLVIGQFGTSIGLLIGTFIIGDQIEYMKNKKLGFDKEQVLVLKGASTLRNQYVAFREQLQTLPQVHSVSIVENLPGRTFNSTLFKPEQPANYKESSLNYMMIDEYGVETLGLNLIEGRNFAPESFPVDVSNFLINQAAAMALGWENPVGKRMTLSNREGQIIGVIEDFHYGSLRQEIKPLVLPYLRWGRDLVVIRLHPGQVSDAIAAVKLVWEKFIPNRPIEYSFLDQDYEKLYNAEQKMAQLFGMFSALAIFIACLGLFGLAAFTAESRTKEIGIRKVLGASVPNLVGLLSREFVKLVLVANVIAWPVAYWAMTRWLANFAYRIDLGAGVFVFSGMITLIVALLTVGLQTFKAARRNPVDALRYE